MKHIQKFQFVLLGLFVSIFSLQTIAQTPAQHSSTFPVNGTVDKHLVRTVLENATVHVDHKTVIENGTVVLFRGLIEDRRNGVLVATEQGNAIAFALFNIQERGKLFIDSQEKVYEGMIVGEHSRNNDLEVNVLKGKKLTNIRASGTDEAVKLVPPVKMSLERMMSYIREDELLEITPKSLRLRKKELKAAFRKKKLSTNT